MLRSGRQRRLDDSNGPEYEEITPVPDQERPYMTWLLRLWRVEERGGCLWRASLENATTGERYGFAGAAGLLAFLRALMSAHLRSSVDTISGHGQDLDA